MKTPFEILLRGTPDGKFQGAHVIDIQGGRPRPIKPEDWPTVCDAIKSMAFATLADVDAAQKELATVKASAAAEVAAKAKELAEYKALVLAEATALKAATLDATKSTDAVVLAAVEKVLSTETERKVAALKAQQDAITAQLAALTTS